MQLHNGWRNEYGMVAEKVLRSCSSRCQQKKMDAGRRRYCGIGTAEYRRVITDNGGITDEKIILRIGKAISMQRLMQSLGTFHGGYSTERCLKLYKTFIRPLWEYAMHLSPISVKVWHKLYEDRNELMEAIFGKWARQHAQRPSHLCHLEPDKYRRVVLLQKLLSRLEDQRKDFGRGDIESRTLESKMKEKGAEKVLIRSEIFDEWDKIETQRKIRMPTDNRRRLNSSLTLKQDRDMNLCSQWFFGRFPRTQIYRKRTLDV